MPIALIENVSFILQNQESYASSLREGLSQEELSLLKEGVSRKSLDFPAFLQIAAKLPLSMDDLCYKSLPLVDDLRRKNIKMLLLDVDGVLTDAGMYYMESGEEAKKFNAKDGLAIRRLCQKGFAVGFISSSIHVNIIRKRAERLMVPYVWAGEGVPKNEIAQKWLDSLGYTFEQVAYIGDDLNDMPMLDKVGIASCPADAVSQVKKVCHLVLNRKGGEGCVREFIEDVMGWI